MNTCIALPARIRRRPWPVIPRIALFALSVLLLAPPSARSAEPSTGWDGGAGSPFNWSGNNNWNPDGQPPYGIITFSGTVGNANIMDQSYSMNQVFWNTNGPWTLNVANSAVLSLFDFSGGQAKVENDTTNLLTINAPITFAANNASPPNPFGELNAVNSDITFGSGATLTVSGSSCNGIKLFGGGHVINFNNTVSASGKWFGHTTSGTGNTININGAFTASDFYVMNGGTVNLNSGGSLTGNVRLGGDFGTTGNQNQTKSGTFNLAAATGGQTFSGVINSVSGNTSAALVVNSQNTSGANTLSGHIALDSDLKISEGAGGTLNITQAKGGDNTTGTDIKGNTLTLTSGTAGVISHSGTIYNSTGAGNLTITGTSSSTNILSGVNTFTGVLTFNAGKVIFTTPPSVSGGNLGNPSGITFGGSSTTTLLTTSGAGSVTISSPTITLSPSSTGLFQNGAASGTTFEISAKLTGTGNCKQNTPPTSGAVVRFSNNTSDYSGVFTMAAGFVEFTSVANSGSPSSLGAGSSAYAIANSSSAATFRYVGSGSSSTTRNLDWQGTTGGLSLDSGPTASGPVISFLGTGNLRSGNGNATLSLTGSSTGNNTLAQVINDGASSGTTSVSVTGSSTGTWILSGANTYSGGTTLNSGPSLLGIGNASALGTGTFTVSGNSSFDNLSGGPLTIANPLTLSASPTFIGSANLAITGPVLLSGANRTLTVNANTLTLGGQITGAFTLTKAGAGTLTLNNPGTADTHNGTLVTAGTLDLGGTSQTLGAMTNSGTCAIQNGTVNASIYVNTPTAGNTVTMTASLAGTAVPLFHSGNGTNILLGVNTYSGGTVIGGTGTLIVTNDSGLGSASGALTFTASGVLAATNNGASVNNPVTISSSRTIFINNASTANFYTPDTNNLIIAALISGGGGNVLKKSSSFSLGTVRFANDNNSYTGDFTTGFGNTEFTSVNDQGTTSSLGVGSPGTGGAITINNATSSGTLRYVGSGNSSTHRPLTWTGTTASGYTLDASGSGTVQFLSGTTLRSGTGGATTLILRGSNTGANTLAHVINDLNGATSLTKNDAGTWVLTAANTFTGPVSLSGGALQVKALETPGTSGPLGKSGTITFSGGILQYSSADNADYSSRFSAAAGQPYKIDCNGQTVNYGTALTSSGGSLTVSSSSAGGKLALAGANAYSGSTSVTNGTLALSGSGTLSGATFSSPLFVGTAPASAAVFDVSGVTGQPGTPYSLASGQILKGYCTVHGALKVAGGSTLSPGASIGTMYFDTAPTLAGTLSMEIDKTALTNDQLVVNTGGGTLAYGGTLAITFLTGSAAAGDAYPLFVGASDASPKFSGSFGSISPSSPGTGLAWDTSTLATDGKLRVTCTAPTAATVGGNQSVCGLTSTGLGANTPTVGGGTWTKFSGPGNVTFNPSATTANATAAVDAVGTYVFRWTIHNPACLDTSLDTHADVQLIYSQAPSVASGPSPSSQAVCSGSPATFSVNASGGSLTYAWRKRGTGWGGSGAWALNTSSGSGSFFIGSSTDNNSGDPASNGGNDINNGGKAWAIFNNGGVSDAVRTFSSGLAVGQTVSLDLDNGNVQGGGTVGLGLQNSSGQNRLEFYFVGGAADYTVNDGTVRDSTIGFTRSGVNVQMKLTGTDTYSITIKRYSDSATATLTGTLEGTLGTTISRIRLFNASAGDCGFGCNNNTVYYNNISVEGFDDNASNYTAWNNGDNFGNSPLANTGNISGADTPTLAINPATTSDAGTYDIVLYSSCGRTVSGPATLAVNPNPTVTVNSPAVCASALPATITATPAGGTGPYGYAWTVPGGPNPGNVASFSASVAGLYSVVVTDAHGCTGSGSGTLTVKPNPTVTVNSPTVCASDLPVAITATVSGGTGPYTYIWTAPGGQSTGNVPSFNATVAGFYSVVVIDANGCSGSGSGTFTINPNPTVTVNSPTACAGALPATMAATPAGGTGPYSYAWTVPGGPNPGNVASFGATVAGLYSVVVTDGHGCTGSGSGTLTISPNPTAVVSGSTTICPSHSTTIQAALTGTGPWTVTWSDGLSHSVSANTDSRLVSPVSTTTYTVTSLSDTKCTAQPSDLTGSAVVTVQDLTPPMITCPPDLTDVHTDPGQCSAASVSLGTPITSDNCDILTVSNNAPALFPHGTTTVTWTVVDTSGNTATCPQLVTVVDHEAPTIICPADITAHTSDDGTGNCSTTITIAPATATDNCDLPGAITITGTRSDLLALTDPFPKGPTTIHWTATDTSANATACDQTVTVLDDEPPTITFCPPGQDLGCNPLTLPTCADVSALVQTSDNCPGPVTVNCSSSDSTSGCTVTRTFTITATDAALNTTPVPCIVVYTWTVAAPVTITCPADITVTASGPAGAQVFFTVTAGGGCTPPPSLLINPPSGSTFPIGTTTVTAVASDTTCGGSDSCNFHVIVNPPPTPQAPEYFFPQAVLPPVGSVYISPALWHQLFAQGIVIRDVRHRGFTQNYPLPPLGSSQTEAFSSEVDFDVSTDNGATFQPASGTAAVTVQVTHTQDVGGTMFFDTEMTQLDISGGSLPAGTMLRESPTLHSTGQTTVRPVPGGYMISSFFDVFTEVSVDNGASWQPANQAGHVEMHPDPKQVSAVGEPTTLLPPPKDEYVSPEQWHALYAQGIVIRDVRHKLFTDALPPPGPGQTNTESFESEVDLQVSTDGGQTYQYVRVDAPPVQVTVINHGSSANTIYDTEMTMLNLSLPSGVMIRESPTEPSRGQTEIEPQSDGTFRVTSFFDIFTELSLDNGATWSPATNGPVRMQLTEQVQEVPKPTPNLPPLDGNYVSPAQWHALYANGIIITNASHDRFTQSQPPPPPAGSQTETFGSRVRGLISMDGGASFTPFSAPATVSVLVASRDLDTGNTRFFDTEMLSLELSGGTLPGGIMVRESPSKASLGRTSVRAAGGGGYEISSFFDIFTEVSLDGGNTWSPSVSLPATMGLSSTPSTPPVTITCPADITVTASGPAGAQVFFTVTAGGGCTPPPSLLINPPSGSTFPIGTTTVTAVANDTCGGSATCNFHVIVNPPPTPQAPEYFFVQSNLPPVGSVYISPSQWHLLFAQGIVIRDVRHRKFTQQFPLPESGHTLPEAFSSEVDFDLSMDNGNTFTPASATADVTVQVTHTLDSSGTSFFDTEMTQLDISGGNLPPGVRLRESPTLHSTGQTTVRPVAGGYMISSFFDVFTELSTDNGASWQPANQAGHVEMHPDPEQVSAVGEPTTLLPPPKDEYVSPEQWHALYAQGIIIRDVRHKLFTGALPPPAPGMTNTENFDSQIDLQVSMDGGNTYQYVRVAAPVEVTVINHGSSANTIYDTEMTMLSIDLPSGAKIRESPTEPSRGQAEIEPQSDGTFRVTSFFDIFTELSLDNGATWSPATNGPVRMQLTEQVAEVPKPTPNLPPLGGQYVSPQQWHALYANGIIITNASHDRFTQSQTPPTTGSQTESFGSRVTGLISMNGGASFSPFSAPANVSLQVSSRADLDTGNTRFFDTEMLSLELSGGTLPGGIMVRESPSKASLGRTSVRAAGGGGYEISSFFDIFTEVSLDGGQTWSPSVTLPATMGLTDHQALAPVITCPADRVLACGDPTDPAHTGTATATDNCDGNVTITYSDAPTPPGCAGIPGIDRTWTAADDCGNSSSCLQHITVEDHIKPAITQCAPDAAVECPSLVPAPNDAAVVATDNCGGTVTVTHDADAITTGDCPNHYVIHRTYYAMDACGNSSSCVQTITVHDDLAPLISQCAPDATAECASLVPGPTDGAVLATDNCGGAVTVTHEADVITPGDCPNHYTIARTYHAIDSCGNSSSCVQHITVHDDIAPLITQCAADATVECASLVPGPTDGAVLATDNCGGAVTVTHEADVITPGDCLNHYTIARTYHAIDSCGNSSSCVQHITVHDDIAPLITQCAADATVECASLVSGPNDAAVLATDNCGGTVTVTHGADAITTGDCPSHFVIHRTYYATDACGNSSSCVQTITVHDDIAPIISQCAADTTVECPSLVPAPSDAAVLATDNCGGAVTVTHDADVIVTGDCPNHYVIHRTYHATDACGNHSECVQTITVHDDIAPIVTAGSVAACYPSVALAEAAAIAATTASDNCSGTPALSASTVGTCSATITVTATDGCGNHASVDYHTQIIGPPIFGTIAATESAVDVKNCANITVQGTVNISVAATNPCGLSGVPTVWLTNGVTAESATYDSETPPGTFNYHWDVTPATSNGTWQVTITAADTCQSASAQFNLCMNAAQLTGQVQLEGFVGTGTVPLHTRTVVFVATDGPGTNANVLMTWTMPLSNVSGDTFAYSLSDVPPGIHYLSAKSDYSLRSKIPVTLDQNGQASGVNFTGPKRLRGGDFDGDNMINLNDYSILAVNFFSYTSAADITGDGAVDFDDYVILATNWFTEGDAP